MTLPALQAWWPRGGGLAVARTGRERQAMERNGSQRWCWLRGAAN